jgi:hypothetical protein
VGSAGTSIFVDKSGNAYLAGITDSSEFQITSGTLATTVPNYPFNSTFVLKVNSAGALVYSTIIPGNAPDNFGSSNNLGRTRPGKKTVSLALAQAFAFAPADGDWFLRRR